MENGCRTTGEMNISTTHNMYFIAIMCPQELDKKILKFKQWVKEHFGSVVALKSPAHITLVQPFWFEVSKEENLLKTLSGFISDLDHLDIRLDGFADFIKKVLFVRVMENYLHEKLKCQAEDHFVKSFDGLVKKDNRPFHPHVTIANRDMKPGDFEKASLYFSKKIFKEEFSSKTISLLRLIDGKWNVIAEKNWSQ